MNADIRCKGGWYREEKCRGIPTVRLWCGDAHSDWTELTSDPEQSDIEDAVADALREVAR